MNNTINTSFMKRWKINTIAAYAVGLGILHPLIAHGITGDHEQMLNTPEFIMHSISIFCFALLLTVNQNKTWQMLGHRRLFTGLLPMVVFIYSAFWLGYYTLYIPFDILFMFLAIGTLNGFGFKDYLNRPKRWIWQSLAAHFAGAVVGILVGLGGYLLFFKHLTGLVRDFTVWIGISVPAGITVALISGWFLRRQIPLSREIAANAPIESANLRQLLSGNS